MSRTGLSRVVRPVIGRFPQFFYRLSPLAGWVAYQLRPGVRRNVVRNMLPLCDGDLPRARREALRACRYVAQYWVDLASLPRRNMARFEAERINLINGERLAVLDTPGPVVAVSAHMGNVELVIQALTYRGRDFIALVEALDPPEWSRYLLNLRSSTGGSRSARRRASSRCRFRIGVTRSAGSSLEAAPAVGSPRSWSRRLTLARTSAVESVIVMGMSSLLP